MTSFQALKYICRQGTSGNLFYILTEGECVCTSNTDDPTVEKEIKKIYPGDSFGEFSMTNVNSKRLYNIISKTSVVCMSVSRNTLQQILEDSYVKENQKKKNHKPYNKINYNGSYSNYTNSNTLFATGDSNNKATISGYRRRISAFNRSGVVCDLHMLVLLKRIGKFLTESLYCSFYSYYYIYFCLILNNKNSQNDNKNIKNEINFIEKFLNKDMRRNEALRSIRNQVSRILFFHHCVLLGLRTRNNNSAAN